MEPIKNRLAWLIGGAQGSGVDSAANVFVRACAAGGLHIFGKREYYSNIMGEHSYFEVRVSDRPVLGHTDKVDLLASFDTETVILHSPQVVEEGGILYDPKLTETPLEKLPTLEARARSDAIALLREEGLDTTMGSMLELARRRGVRTFPLPYEDLLKGLSEERGGLPFATLKRMVNVMAVAASLHLVGLELRLLVRALSEIFKGKEKVIELNARAAELVYEYAAQHFEPFARRLEPLAVDGDVDPQEERIYLVGNQAVALGKLAAGCRVQTYYPISPATDESTYLEAHERFAIRGKGEGEEKDKEEHDQGMVLVLQTEDEIAAVTAATGAALAGARAATSTSGPGFSLMAEGLGWAGMNEVPLVVTLYQRGGPSTGLPTRTEQGDLRFALHAGHGEFPRLVLASGDLKECFYDAIRAFNYAERYQTPVIHLLDKFLANSGRTYPLSDFDLSKTSISISIERGALLSDEEAAQLSGGYRRFRLGADGDGDGGGLSPRTVLGQPGGIFWLTGDEHTEEGHITEDPVIRSSMMEKRARKLETAAAEIPLEEQLTLHGDPEAPVTVVSWGSTKGAVLEALERLAAQGHRVNFLQVRLLCPLPASAIEEVLRRARVRVGVETNFSGQLAGLLRERTGIALDHLILKYNGRALSVDEIHTGLLKVLAGEAPYRMVMSHGV